LDFRYFADTEKKSETSIYHILGLTMSEPIEEQVNQLVSSIKNKRRALDGEANRFRTHEIISKFDKQNYDSWCISVIGDSLVRLRLFTEQNFNFIETMGIISVARYIFELSVWLQLFKLDSRYGLVYYAQLLDTQRRYWKDYREQLDREIFLLKNFEQQEKDALSEAVSQIKHLSDLEQQRQAAYDSPKAVAGFIDKQAARHFSIYAEQAKVNGYGFQAHLVEKKLLPQIDKALAEIDSEKAAFDSTVPQQIQDLIPNRWNWRQMAQIIGSVDEYDFIYRFSSKLLHATPASITTDQKNLEMPELAVFLKYIYVKVDDVLELASAYPIKKA
jgi:hypothetical protein